MATRRGLIGFIAGLGVLDCAGAVAAGAPMSKSQVGYQDIPHDGRQCDQCVYFVPGAAQGTAPAQGRCKLVAGLISPSGWCEIWQPKA